LRLPFPLGRVWLLKIIKVLVLVARLWKRCCGSGKVLRRWRRPEAMAATAVAASGDNGDSEAADGEDRRRRRLSSRRGAEATKAENGDG
jgi:hypothetical protein